MGSGADEIIVGIDVGSTTVKTVAVDTVDRRILWSRYERHEARQAEKVEEQLLALNRTLLDVAPDDVRVFVTGSGAGPLAEPLGAKFVQEVNAVTFAVEALHPDVGSVIELGGQDAKIIIYTEREGSDDRRAIASMNDKCASGTGATIDKCFAKVGADPEEVLTLAWNDAKLHPVAAKCGVFAETDIVNLVKSGIPSPEILCSLADAIVMQNLSVLTRGNTLRHKVLLLGGPNTYLGFLRDCWRLRIRELWDSRDYPYPRNVPVEELIFAPDDAELYAAYGAAIYGLHEPASVGRYRGVEHLQEFIRRGRSARLGSEAGPPLVTTRRDQESFVERYRIPTFEAATLSSGEVVRGYIGLDGGSTSSKAVLIDPEGEVLCKQYLLSKGNPIQDAKDIFTGIREFAQDRGATLDVLGFGVTGYAADVLEESVSADVNVVETVAHMMAAVKYFDEVDVICDVGGQDIKVLFMVNGQIRSFRLSNQCSAGNGMLLQAMASQFGVPVTEYADTAFAADCSPNFSYGCAVFLDADRVTFQREGYSKEEILAGLALVLPKNIWQYVVQVPRMAELGTRYVLQGGAQYNQAAVKAQRDYIRERVPDAEIFVHPHPGEAGALGAALEAMRVVERRGDSTFIGVDDTIGLEYTTRNDDGTTCHFCPNHCSRTFIDTKAASGRTSRYIAGFSCEQGTVESEEALVALTRERKRLKKQFPNLVDYEAKLAFRSFFEPEPLPEQGTLIDDVQVGKSLLGRVRRKPIVRPMERSSEKQASRRRGLRIGIPRVLNMYSTAPLWRTYFESLGVEGRNVVFSEYTNDEMWAEGSKYGSIDPCFPAKVTQAHVHNLLFRKHAKEKLDYVFFPCITHLPTFVEGVIESASCPIVAGAPKVTEAAFTKEIDYFERAGVEYVSPAVTLVERHYFKHQMFEAWGERLGITRHESDFACEQGFAALQRFDDEMQRRGLDILEQIEQDNDVAILLLGRPYHNDPGLNHAVLEEFQALGFPILSIRSIPKDPAWLRRFFEEDLQRGLIGSPLETADVWPENYSTNSVQKVWAAKFAARHPHVVVLDLSSFKCGHDAPTYGMIDSIISSSTTPYSALHDIDANKPRGSMQIRVKTYAYTLGLHKEGLADVAARRSDLEKRVEAKRRELLQQRRVAADQRRRRDRVARRERRVMDAAYAEYLAEDPVLRLVDARPSVGSHCGSNEAAGGCNAEAPAPEPRRRSAIQGGRRLYRIS